MLFGFVDIDNGLNMWYCFGGFFVLKVMLSYFFDIMDKLYFLLFFMLIFINDVFVGMDSIEILIELGIYIYYFNVYDVGIEFNDELNSVCIDVVEVGIGNVLGGYGVLGVVGGGVFICVVDLGIGGMGVGV